MNYHRNDPNGFFQMSNGQMVQSLIEEMFDDQEVKPEDLIFLTSTPEVFRKFHRFLAKFFSNKNVKERLPLIHECIEETLRTWEVMGEINLTYQSKLVGEMNFAIRSVLTNAKK